MYKRLLIPVVLMFLATACASPPSQPQSLDDLLKRHASELQSQCRSYYFMREPRLVYPDPEQICRQVYSLTLRGKAVTNWKM